MEAKITENIKYFPGLSEDVLKQINDSIKYINLDLSHENFEHKIGVPEGLKFAPRIDGDNVVSFDLIKE